MVAVDRSTRGVYRLERMPQFDLGQFDLGETFESVRTEPEEFIDAGDHVVTPMVGYSRGRDGIEVTARFTYLWTFRDGTAVRVTLYQEQRKPSKPPGCRSRRCRRRFPVGDDPGRFDAFNRGDYDAWVAVYDEDVEFSTLPRLRTPARFAAMPEYGHGSPSCRRLGARDSGSSHGASRWATMQSSSVRSPRSGHESGVKVEMTCTSSAYRDKRSFGQGASSTETRPSKPPGFRSRRCRRRTWRSCGGVRGLSERLDAAFRDAHPDSRSRSSVDPSRAA